MTCTPSGFGTTLPDVTFEDAILRVTDTLKDEGALV